MTLVEVPAGQTCQYLEYYNIMKLEYYYQTGLLTLSRLVATETTRDTVSGEDVEKSPHRTIDWNEKR